MNCALAALAALTLSQPEGLWKVGVRFSWLGPADLGITCLRRHEKTAGAGNARIHSRRTQMHVIHARKGIHNSPHS